MHSKEATVLQDQNSFDSRLGLNRRVAVTGMGAALLGMTSQIDRASARDPRRFRLRHPRSRSRVKCGFR